jgi:hypothetical protein
MTLFAFLFVPARNLVRSGRPLTPKHPELAVRTELHGSLEYMSSGDYTRLPTSCVMKGDHASTPIPTGSSTIWARIGSIRCTSCRSREASQMTSVWFRMPFRMAKSAPANRSCPGRGPSASSTWPMSTGTIPISLVIPTSSTPTSTRSVSSATGISRVAWRMRSISTCFFGGRRSSRTSRISRSRPGLLPKRAPPAGQRFDWSRGQLLPNASWNFAG